MYSVYEHCDPFSTGIVKKLDQMLPYFTMTIAKDAFGLPGLFIAGIFSAALATMSSSLNALAGTLFEDIIKPYTSDFSEKARSNVMKVSRAPGEVIPFFGFYFLIYTRVIKNISNCRVLSCVWGLLLFCWCL